MKTIASALIALSLITAIAAPASALDSKEFWQQQDQRGPAGDPCGPGLRSAANEFGSGWDDLTNHGELP